MGNERVEKAVCDAGPVIHLYEVDSLLFLRLFQSLYVPAAVWRETVEAHRVPEADILALGNISLETVNVHRLKKFIHLHSLQHLQKADQECLFLCKSLNCPLLLTDDLAVRKQARRLGYTPVGSLGIIVRACRTQIIDVARAKELLNALYHQSTLFVTYAIIEQACDQL
ncbi:MAG: hypothetical protein KIT45_15230 [Fimbriimonadia bacterium]|nr:hypothetical protein [Fimbriimonadia bacterium]